MASHHYEALTGIQTVVRALTLVGPVTGLANGVELPDDQVYLRKLPTDRGVTLPCVQVTLWPVPESQQGVQNSTDDYGYPCGVTIVTANNQDLDIVEQELIWRQTIRNAFHNKKPAALQSAMTATVLNCVWEPAAVFALDLFREENLFVSSAVIRVITREART